jgi:hypothetical protein
VSAQANIETHIKLLVLLHVRSTTRLEDDMLWLIFLHAQMDHLTPEMFSKILNHIRDKWITSSKDYPDPDTSL